MESKCIVEYFIDLIRIDSESKNEKEVAVRIADDLIGMGAEVHFDSAHDHTGGNVGNLYARFKGDIEKDPILFCAHMDTVKPGNGITPVLERGMIHTDGTTILGSDDKSGIAQIVCAIHKLQEAGEKLPPIEILFTISEEIGLLGAKHADYNWFKSKMGYALDSHTVGEFMTAAPSQNSIRYIIHGKESHAGMNPQDGVNAIQIAASAIAKIKLGRIDEETTCNIGVIEGGLATNIVPNKVVIKGEARSHDPKKLAAVTQRMTDAIKQAVEEAKTGFFTPTADVHVHQEYQSFSVPDDAEVVRLAVEASKNAGLEPRTYRGGGGSDANIIGRQGIAMIVGGTGMDNVHTVNEKIKISDLEDGCKWVEEVIRLYAAK